MSAAIRIKKSAWRLARAAREPFTSDDCTPEYEIIRKALKRMLAGGVLTDKALEKITRHQFDRLSKQLNLNI